MTRWKFILALIFSLHYLSAAAQEADMDSLFEARGEQYFSFLPLRSISDYSRIISIDKIDEQGRVYAYANRREFQKFLELQKTYRFEKEVSLLISGQMASSVAAFMQYWDTYPTYLQYDSIMQKLAADYPALCRYHDLGSTPGGHKILALQLGDNVQQHEAEPRFLYTSSMHGNELTGYVLLLRLANFLLSNYGQNALVDSLMNNVEIWINPLANPDGAYYYSDTSISGAKRYNYNMVDLNRNFPDPQMGQHPDGSPWQTETQIFMSFADTMHFSMAANFHGGAEVINYPWDTWSRLTADNDWWLYVSHQYADSAQFYGPPNYFKGPSGANGTGVINGYQWYPIYGGRQDYMNYFQHCREFTVELTNVKVPQAALLTVYWDANYRSLLNYMNQQRFGLKGFVTDSASGKPIEAMISILAHDKDSSQVCSHLPYGDYYRLLDSGFYDIVFSAPHYKSKAISAVWIQRDSLVSLNVALATDPAALEDVQAVNWRVYPNPADDAIFIESDRRLRQLALWGMDGRIVKQRPAAWQTRIKLDISGIAPGVYFLGVADEKGRFTYRKLIIR